MLIKYAFALREFKSLYYYIQCEVSLEAFYEMRWEIIIIMRGGWLGSPLLGGPRGCTTCIKGRTDVKMNGSLHSLGSWGAMGKRWQVE